MGKKTPYVGVYVRKKIKQDTTVHL